MDKGMTYNTDHLPISLESDWVNLLKAIYHENHKVDKVIRRT
jgi:hypothetical protein